MTERIIGHLLVAAAPSGAGKSTFIDHLLASKLTDEIQAKLPANVKQWPRIKHGQYQSWQNSVLATEAVSGIILEYDMSSIRAREGFRNDPALTLMLRAQKITIVNLYCLPEQLIQQVAYRETGAQSGRSIKWKKYAWAAGYFVRAAAFAPLRFLTRVLPRRTLDQLKQRPIVVAIWSRLRWKGLYVKIRRYEQVGWLSDLYDRWQEYLQFVAGEGAIVKQLFFEPSWDVQPGDACHWREMSNLAQRAAPSGSSSEETLVHQPAHNRNQV
jgi:hypothetical protein